MSDTASEERARRAEARRRAWPKGEVVRAGSAKPALYAELDVAERLAQMTALCRAQWLASGRKLVELPRSEWPGEVFEIKRGRDRAPD